MFNVCTSLCLERNRRLPAEVKLLSDPTNYAVVHLPQRRFPGVVFQGDSLKSFIADLEEAATEPDPGEKAAALEEVIERLKAIRARYESVLGGAGMELPY